MSAVSVSESGVRPILADAVDLARRALLELEPAGVGAHLGVATEDDSAATHRFEATLPGYRGWQWAVVVAAPPEADYATVSESALLPGPDALVAPDFVPWDQRIRPGDLAPGDLLAPPPNDPRLVPGYVATGDPAVDEVALEIGLGRTQVLSLEGREEAAERWYAEFGPEADMAKAAPSTCGLCGFYLPLAGSLRAAFGVCGNAMGADGHVVHAAYGCGAHSDTVPPTGGGSPLYEAFDDAAVDMIPTEALVAPVEAETASAAADAATDIDTSAAQDAESASEPVASVVESAVPDAAVATPAAEIDSPDVESADAETPSGVADSAAAAVASNAEATQPVAETGSVDAAVVPDAAHGGAIQASEGGAAIASTQTASEAAVVAGAEPSVEVAAEPSVEEAVLADSGDSVVAPSGDAVPATSGDEQVVDGAGGAVESSPQS